MIRSYATPLAFKAALEQRLRNEASRSRIALQRLRQQVVFERYLARLFSVLDDRVVLKGGLVVELRAVRARTTKDIDLNLVGDPSDLLELLQKAGRLELEDRLTFEIQPDPHHPRITAPGLHYEGMRYRAEARLADKIYGEPFGVDVALADPTFEKPDLLVGSTFLSFAGIEAPTFRVCALEAHLAEKLHVSSRQFGLSNRKDSLQ